MHMSVKHVLVLLLLSIQSSDMYDSSLSAHFLSAVMTQFHSGCLFLHQDYVNTSRPSGDILLILKQLFTWNIHVALATYDSFENLRCSSRPLHVIVSGTSATRSFLEKVKFHRKGIWLLSKPEQQLDEYLRKVYIPLDCQFLVKLEHQVVEVYRILPGMPLRVNVVCKWHQRSLRCVTDSMYDRRNDLEGLQLRAVTKDGLPFIKVTVQNGQVEVSSFIGRVWHILEQRMNFTTEYTVTPRSTYSELVATVNSGEVDLALSYVTVTWKRAPVVDFTSPLLFSCYYVYIEKISDQDVVWDNFLKPFSFWIWILIGVTCFGIGISFGLIVWQLHHVTEEKHTFDLGSCFFTILSIFCNQGQAKSPHSFSGRILYFTCYISGITLLAAYSAMLISFLTIRQYKFPFKDIEGLLADGRYKFGMAKGSAEHSIVEHSNDPTLKELSKKLRDPTVPLESLKGLQYVCGTKFAYMTTMDYAQAHKHAMSCKMVFLPQFSLHVSVAIPLAKGSPYLGLFNHNIRRMRRSGLIGKLMDDTRPRLKPIRPVPLKTVSFEDIVPILAALFVGTVVAVLMACIERVIRMYQHVHL